jgi:curved DNA-binding protein CbpA
MKSGSQFLIAIRLLTNNSDFHAKLTLGSKNVQARVYFANDEIRYVETSDYFPASWLTKMGLNDLVLSLSNVDTIAEKQQILKTVTDNPELEAPYLTAVKNQLRTFFESEVNECKLKAERLGPSIKILSLVDFYFDCASAFVREQTMEDLIPNEQITFQVSSDYMNKSGSLKMTSQHGYLLSRLEKPMKLSDIYSMVPGNADGIRRDLLDLWAFGVLDSQVLNQYVPRVDRAVAAPAGDESVKDLVAAVNQTYLSLSRKDFYGLLGINANPEIGEIKSAYYKLAKKFHPDRFYGVDDPILKEKVDVIFAAINVAYETLKNSKKRTEYDNSPADKRVISSTTIISDVKSDAAKQPQSPEKVGRMAEEHARQAQKAYEDGNYQQAVQFLKSATKISPNVAKYWRQLGIAMTKGPQWRKEAEDSFYHAIQLEPRNPENHLHLGFLYKISGLRLRARKQFSTVLQLEPRSDIAARELGELDAEEEKERQTKKGGRLGGLFKKK